MTDAPLSKIEEDEALAGEYVLGVLDAAARAAVEARIRREPDFARRIVAWERRLAGLNTEFVPVAPAPDLLARIETRLFPTPPERSLAARLGWRGWGLGGLAVAAIALAVLLVQPGADPGLVVTMATADQSLIYRATFHNQELVVSRDSGTGAPAGHSHELWIIAPAQSPVSLGVLGEEALHLPYPEPPAGWVLAVSVEPAGGSPTGAPTRPVILTAEIGA